MNEKIKRQRRATHSLVKENNQKITWWYVQDNKSTTERYIASDWKDNQYNWKCESEKVQTELKEYDKRNKSYWDDNSMLIWGYVKEGPKIITRSSQDN